MASADSEPGDGTASTAEASESAQAPSDTAGDTATTAAERDARIEALEAENARLRSEYTRLRHTGYRRTVIGLAAIGGVAAVGGVVFPDVRGVLFALGATGLFAAVLTVWITPERFVSADVGERIYTALAATHDAAIAELGLEGTPVYVPGDRGPRLYIPQQATDEHPPADADLTETFVVDAEAGHGLSVTPTGAPLIEELQGIQTLPARGEELAVTLADAVVEVFGLADGVDADVDAEAGRAVFEVDAPVYGEPARFDHPIGSVLAVGLAVGLEAPVHVDIAETEPLVVVCRWEHVSDGSG